MKMNIVMQCAVEMKYENEQVAHERVHIICMCRYTSTCGNR